MAIEKVTNPADDSQMIIAKGIIQRIIYKPVKDGVDKFGNTHNASIQVDGDYINFINMKVPEGREPKLQKVTGTAPNLEWHDIEVGDEIKAVLKQNGEWQGKPQYTTGTSKINIIKKGAAVTEKPKTTETKTASSSKSVSTKKVFGEITAIVIDVASVKLENGEEVSVVLGSHDKEVQVGGRLAANINQSGEIVSGFKAYGPKAVKDDLGIKVGNSLSVALEAGLVTKSKDIPETLPELLQQIEDVKEDVIKDNPNMDSYALGARFGQSVVTAARLAKKGTSTETILSEAVVIFDALNGVEKKVREGVVKDNVDTSQETSQVKESVSDLSPDNEDYDDMIPF